MIKGKYIVLVILIALILGTITYFYFFQEKPAQDIEKNYVPITIFAVDDTGQMTSTGYKVLNNDNVLSEGKTNRFGDVIERVPINSTIKIQSYNLDKQNFYVYSTEEKTIKDNSSRFRLILKTPRELDITHKGEIKDESSIIVTLKSNYYQSPIFCLKWSSKILRINVNYDEIDVPQGYTDYYKCYDMGKTIKSKTTIKLDLDVFGEATEKDFISLKIVDRDFVINDYKIRENPIIHKI